MRAAVSGQIRECYRRAEDCARKATAQTDPTLKADFLDLERRWLVLARSYDFTERLNSFTKNSPKPNIKRTEMPFDDGNAARKIVAL